MQAGKAGNAGLQDGWGEQSTRNRPQKFQKVTFCIGLLITITHAAHAFYSAVIEMSIIFRRSTSTTLISSLPDQLVW